MGGVGGRERGGEEGGGRERGGGEGGDRTHPYLKATC